MSLGACKMPEAMNKIFVTADFHASHSNIIRYCGRPFKDASHMNEVLIANNNMIVDSQGTVYHLGDFSMSLTAVKKILPQLNGKHYLILGNHDRSSGAAIDYYKE